MKTLSTLTHLECSICGERHDAEVVQTICTSCGRALVARYDLAAAARTFTREAIGQRVSSMWRRMKPYQASRAMAASLHQARLGT